MAQVVKGEATAIDDDTRWLAMAIRQGLLVICRAIEKRYGIDPVSKADRERLAYEFRTEARRQ